MSNWLHQLTGLRLALAASGVSCVALFLYAARAASNVELTRQGASRSPALRELVGELHVLRATWDPQKRKRILARAPEHAARFLGPLSRILRLDDHDVLEEAVIFAGAMQRASIRPELVAIVQARDSVRPSIRMAAVHAAERLQPWPVETLSELLTNGTVPLRLAVLQVCANRADAPWFEILALLNGEPLEGVDAPDRALLREAAMLAVPRRPQARVVQELFAIAMADDAGLAAAAVKTLGRIEPDQDLRVRLLGLLPQIEGGALCAAFDVLVAWGLRPENAGPLWSLVQSQHAALILRARALACLEKTRSFRATDLRAAAPSWPPLLSYFAARCLLVEGDNRGFVWLLDLLDESDAAAVPRARQLLAWLTGRAPGSKRAEFEEAMPLAMNALPTRTLPQPIWPIDE